MTQLDIGLLLLTVLLAVVAFQPRLQRQRRWQLIVTPLASIIGSGFLVVAPLLGRAVGEFAPWAMLGIVVAAYGIGAIIRFNIRYAEPQLAAAEKTAPIVLTERVSNVMLTVAYIISVAFYIRLLAAFVLRGIGVDSDFAARILTSGVLILIALVGWWQGLNGLERLEKYSVTIKLCIIGTVIVGLGHFDIVNPVTAGAFDAEPGTVWETARILGGMLLVVQGFETSRYIGAEYPAPDRVTGMRHAQVIAGCIYIVFVFLITPLLPGMNAQTIDETAIVDLAARVAIVLPPLLIVAAVMSQFSAAVADTVGAGGLVEEESNHRYASRDGYALVCVLAVVLVWTSDIFEIISLASRAFAGYYFVQVLVALQVVPTSLSKPRRWLALASLTLAAIVLLMIAIFARATSS